MVQLISRKAMNLVVSHHDGVRGKVHEEAKGIEAAAKAGLEEARASTRWHKIHGPAHLTSVSSSQGEVDAFANLNAPNPMAIEFGHAPSGVFGHCGALGHLKTKAPEGLYILHKAAGFGIT
jgi:Family of unknown function (DUF5403)